MIRFWVHDSGEGLTPQEKKVVFQKYTRLNKEDKKGYGIGLSIVKRIIEKLGGEVGIDDKIDSGTRFYFTLPTVNI